MQINCTVNARKIFKGVINFNDLNKGSIPSKTTRTDPGIKED